jgi:hypothetical protein
MTGLLAIVVLGVLLILACWAFVWTYKAKRRKGKSDAVAFGWAVAAVVALSLPITWDAIPTWIAFEYYAKKEAGIQVFKTLEQWKAENPGMAETLVPYGFKDKRGELENLGNEKFRYPLNDRFAYDSSKVNLFLSVYAVRYEVIDRTNEVVLVRHTGVVSGNSGGLATGGSGWWALWLIHKTPDAVSSGFFNYVEPIRALGAKK